ncbi:MULTISPECIES: FAD-dependent oxidoreductase [unclassified Bradyrhizobium]|uniref:NAD(P)/FAD-dependent oxidoreductase n=1 Tax=unclassified Bradyrhizobium TaxID=2631580 RepID=UPI0028E5E2F0|nr:MULTISPECIES: FAD-dependent oxidoreductase [unclassified Bradyrhizobium]
MREAYDVLIFGSGVAGLMAAMKLGRIGLKVLLIEKDHLLASGSSTRNVGWLHSGAYHAGSIVDRGAAISVAKHCIYGYEQICRFFPEVILDNQPASHALLRDESRAEELTARWVEAGVTAKATSVADAQKHHTEACFSGISHVFETKDVSIDTRLFYRRLLNEANACGVRILLGTEIRSISDDRADIEIRNDNIRLTVTADIFIYATGHSTKDIFAQFFGIKLPLRRWKSHMLLTKRLSSRSLFHIDPAEAAIIHHDDISIVNHTNDATLSDTANFDVDEMAASELRAALGRLFPKWVDSNSRVVACIKSDLNYECDQPRSLGVDIQEPRRGHLFIVPGKMTETPYLADALVRLIHARIDDKSIALRPMDVFRSQN